MVGDLWVEAYRPNTIEDYVFRDDHLKQQIKQFIEKKSIPHILLSGPAGTGKSALAKVLINELDVNPGDVLYINVSDKTGVDVVRDSILSFTSTMPWGEFKVILLEEFDFASPSAQAALRRVMEDYADMSRFILTCNYDHKVIPAIKSRTQSFRLDALDKEQFLTKMIAILVNEGVEFDEDTLLVFEQTYYPDLRKTINEMQSNVINGKLTIPTTRGDSTADWHLNAVNLFNDGKIGEARKLICSQLRPEEAEDFFRMCYRNLNWWGDTESKQDQAIIIIRDAIVKHNLVADPEINISACLAQLAEVRTGS